MLFRQIHDETLAQYAYLIGCQQTGEALLIDPERDVDRYLELAEREGLRITSVAETHIHADFLSGARAFAERPEVTVYLSGEGDDEWFSAWAREGDYDAVFLHDGDRFRVGHIEVRAIHTPGHTPEHLSFLVTDPGGGADRPMGIVTGDFVFVGDVGRPDLLESAARVAGAGEPSARRLYASLRRFLELPDYLQIWPGHGAGSACGKALGAVPQSTVGYERRFNEAVEASGRGVDAFVASILADQPEPPLYFARMKRLNKEGVPPLPALPRPRRLDAAELGALAARRDVVVLDARPDREAFMAAHLPGALYAPLTKSFSTVVGSLVEDPAQPIYLIVEPGRVEDVVRDLVRVGYDRIDGFAAPKELDRYFAGGGASAAIERIGFDALEERRSAAGRVLDVRYASEYEAAHVPGALNVAYTRLANRLDEIPADETLFVHCASGVRSAVASAYLEREGRRVVYVDDAFAGWAAKYGEEARADT